MDEYETRLAKVRHRFASTLESKLKDSLNGLPDFVGNGSNANGKIESTYRRFHEIYAVAPTVGFPHTGQAAHEAELVLLRACAEHRSLTKEEAATLRSAFDGLWAAAQSELQSMYNRGG
jgi:hypothetical protein